MVDIGYALGFESSKRGELEGITSRADCNLSVHTETSDRELDYYGQAEDEHWVSYVAEPSTGLTRPLMALLIEACTGDGAPNTKGGADRRVVLRFDPRLMPVKVAAFLLSKKEALSELAWGAAADLWRFWSMNYSDAGAVGRRCRRQDEIDAPYHVAVDFDLISDHVVTVRERDSMAQEHTPMKGLVAYLHSKLPLC